MRIRLLSRQELARWRMILTMLLMSVCAVACQPKQASPANQAATNQSEASALANVKSYHGVGVIKKINPQDPSITIDHEDIKDYMAAMTMEYYVKDRSLLDSIQPGDKVDFTIEDRQGVVLVSEIKKKQ
jgi:Cu/Ag efflux protein CusF